MFPTGIGAGRAGGREVPESAAWFRRALGAGRARTPGTVDAVVGQSVSDLAGRVLAGRYRLLAPIGTGASGRVYVAEDIRLRRRVAVKVLHAALADDAGFLRRFRAEAQVAASLQHPNIMTVHDWGEEDVPFMVLELLAGGSLRAMLDDGTRLTPAQAARVGRDVAAALEYAHARGIVHRDVKPANLLFDEHGIVRVADFGLARALAEASWTEPAGAVLGTARYASPEQALGVALDARSDLYSLALVLVESVTGRVPFAADTTIGTLTARTQRPIAAPVAMGPLRAVIERAGRIEVDERYPDAATMRAALADAADALPPPAPLGLAGTAERHDPHPTSAQVAAATRKPEPGGSPGPPAPALFDQDAPGGQRTVPGPRGPEAATPAEAGRRKEPRGGPRAAAGKAARRRLVPLVVMGVITATLALGVAALAQMGAGTVAVPGLVGRTEAGARSMAEGRGLDVQVTERRVADDPAGTVIEQRPAAGAWAGERSSVKLVVSAGPAPVEVPRVERRTAEQALVALQEAGLVADVRHEYHELIPKGRVIRQSPAAGEELAPESSVRIVVSDGHAPVAVPDLADKTWQQAREDLAAAHLRARRVEEFSDDVERDLVIRTEPAAEAEAPYESEVAVYVSKGPDMVEVPRVIGMSVDEAYDALRDAGLRASLPVYEPGATVQAQDPDPGVRVRRGSTVTLSV